MCNMKQNMHGGVQIMKWRQMGAKDIDWGVSTTV